MRFNLPAEIRRWKRRVTAPGSPFRHLGKLQRGLRNRVVQSALFKTASQIERELTPPLASHVANLREDGFSKAAAELDPGLLAELGEFSQERLDDPQLDAKKTVLRSFMVQLSHHDDLNVEHVLVRFALQDTVLRIAAAYLGEVPYLSSVQIFQSLSTGSTQWGESQLWHQDYEDTKTVKLWVYLTDVTDDPQGPFTFLPLSESRKIKNKFFPGRVSDESVEKQTGGAVFQHVKGPRLTAFYVDSSVCYHMGSRIHPGHSRIVYEATFVTHASLYPIESGIRFGENVSPLHRLVLTR